MALKAKTRRRKGESWIGIDVLDSDDRRHTMFGVWPRTRYGERFYEGDGGGEYKSLTHAKQAAIRAARERGINPPRWGRDTFSRGPIKTPRELARICQKIRRRAKYPRDMDAARYCDQNADTILAQPAQQMRLLDHLDQMKKRRSNPRDYWEPKPKRGRRRKRRGLPMEPELFIPAGPGPYIPSEIWNKKCEVRRKKRRGSANPRRRKKWIKKAIRKPGALRATFKRWYGLKDGQKIPASMYTKGYKRAKKRGDKTTMRRINMARTLNKLRGGRKKTRRRGKVVRGAFGRRPARRKVANPRKRRQKRRRAVRRRRRR